MTTVTQTPPVSERETPRSVTEATAQAAGWGELAAFLSDHPEIAKRARIARVYMLCYVGHLDDPASFMADAARACVDAGGRVEPYQSDRFGGVNLWFGPVHLQVYADIDRVFTRRVTGVVDKVEYTLTFDLPEQTAAASS